MNIMPGVSHGALERKLYFLPSVAAKTSCHLSKQTIGSRSTDLAVSLEALLDVRDAHKEKEQDETNPSSVSLKRCPAQDDINAKKLRTWSPLHKLRRLVHPFPPSNTDRGHIRLSSANHDLPPSL